MRRGHRELVFGFAALIVVTALGQNQPGMPESFRALVVASKLEVPLVPPTAIAHPVVCTPNGTIFAQLVSSTDVELVSISEDGKQTVRFAKEKYMMCRTPDSAGSSRRIRMSMSL